MRVGVLGGAFDPIHTGHLDAARAAQRALALDQVVFVPTRVPPHRDAPRASSYHRFAMAALAIQPYPAFVVSDLELRSPEPSYTAVTLRQLHAHGLAASQIFFITGVDAFAEIATWYDYPAVLDASHFVVVSRPGYRLEDLEARLPGLRGRFVDASSAMPAGATPEGATAIHLLRAQTRDVSSTDVRRRLAGRGAIDDLVPAPVADYASRHRLYQPAPDAAGQLHDEE